MKTCAVQQFSSNIFQRYFLLELRTWYKYSNMVVICKIEASLNTKVLMHSSYNLHLNNQTMLQFWKQHINILYITRCQSQWPLSLRHEMSSPTQTLGSSVWIPLKAWMSLHLFCVCMWVVALHQADRPSKESYQLSKIKKLEWKQSVSQMPYAQSGSNRNR
jgi:hypothetical protein